jgi:hypothetical protein
MPVNLDLCPGCGELTIGCICAEREWAAEHEADLTADHDREARLEEAR